MEKNKTTEKIAVTEPEAQLVLEEIKSIIVEEVGCDEKDVVLEARWKDDIGADSLDMVEIIMAIDRKLNIHVNDTDGWEKNSSLRDSCSGIVRTLKELGRL